MGWGDAAQAELESSPLYIKLLKAFRVFDKNKDGFIDAEELRELLTRVNPSADPTPDGKLTTEDAQTIISSFDDNGDGKLSIEELCAAWAVVGGSDQALKDAMAEKRQQAKEALERRRALAATTQADGSASASCAAPSASAAAPSAEASKEAVDRRMTAAERAVGPTGLQAPQSDGTDRMRRSIQGSLPRRPQIHWPTASIPLESCHARLI